MFFVIAIRMVLMHRSHDELFMLGHLLRDFVHRSISDKRFDHLNWKRDPLLVHKQCVQHLCQITLDRMQKNRSLIRFDHSQKIKQRGIMSIISFSFLQRFLHNLLHFLHILLLFGYFGEHKIDVGCELFEVGHDIGECVRQLLQRLHSVANARHPINDDDNAQTLGVAHRAHNAQSIRHINLGAFRVEEARRIRKHDVLLGIDAVRVHAKLLQVDGHRRDETGHAFSHFVAELNELARLVRHVHRLKMTSRGLLEL
mmetsp:Transcript_43095/g.71177  ORF Transcript_43095/g.71177 Transcript_43095/m.71177 type:complete len:256 (+) Transcript_43095:288-1055(+)